MEALPLHSTFKYNLYSQRRNPLQFGRSQGLSWKNTKTNRCIRTRIEIRNALRISGTESEVHDEVGFDWEREILEEIDPLDFQSPWQKRRRIRSMHNDEDDDDDDKDPGDWVMRARTSALKAIEARGFKKSSIKKLLPKKKKKNSKIRSNDRAKQSREKTRHYGDDDEAEEEVDNLVPLKSDMGKNLARLSESGNRKSEVRLNKAIVEALNAGDVLSQVSEVLDSVSKGLRPSPLSPLNMATALHRIAKNMDKVCMMKSDRLAFARQRDMAVLVGVAMASLPDCSVQGIANIAWALAKIGGESIYWSEMDRIAEVAVTRMGEFNTQNVANLAGAYASMKHAGPPLFAEMLKRASCIASDFGPQELAQFLWSFAALYHPADPLLDSLDSIYNKYDQQLDSKLNAPHTDSESGKSSTRQKNEDSVEIVSLLNNFTRDQLANVAWSYTVLNQMERPFFSYIWNSLIEFEAQRVSPEFREDVMFAWQLHQANKCLKIEYPHLGLSLGNELELRVAEACKTKRFNEKTTSLFQKEVGHLLVSTGFDWEHEYCVDGYTLDAVVREKKVALEIDGPSHFSRNTGSPLGHTMLKRRYLASAGWHVVSLPWQEWEELRGESEQMEYLQTFLKDVL